MQVVGGGFGTGHPSFIISFIYSNRLGAYKYSNNLILHTTHEKRVPILKMNDSDHKKISMTFI